MDAERERRALRPGRGQRRRRARHERPARPRRDRAADPLLQLEPREVAAADEACRHVEADRTCESPQGGDHGSGAAEIGATREPRQHVQRAAPAIDAVELAHRDEHVVHRAETQ